MKVYVDGIEWEVDWTKVMCMEARMKVFQRCDHVS